MSDPSNSSNTSDSSNTSLDVDLVRRVARLAGLTLGDGEAERLVRVLAHLRALGHGGTEEHGDTEGAAAGSRREPGALRADVPGADPLAAPAGDGAPDFRDGFFVVPRLASHAEDAE